MQLLAYTHEIRNSGGVAQESGLWPALQEGLMPAQVQEAVLPNPLPGTAGLEALPLVHHPRVIYWHLGLPPKKERTDPHFPTPDCHTLEETQKQ